MLTTRRSGLIAIGGLMLACGSITPPPAIDSGQPKPTAPAPTSVAVVCPPAPEPSKPAKLPPEFERPPNAFPVPHHCIATPTEKHKTIEAALQGTWCESIGGTGLRFEGDQHWSDDGRMRGVDVRVHTFEVLPVSESSIRQPRSHRHHVLRTFGDHEFADPRNGTGASVEFFHFDFSTTYYRSASSNCLCFQDSYLVHLARWHPDSFDTFLELFERAPKRSTNQDRSTSQDRSMRDRSMRDSEE